MRKIFLTATILLFSAAYIFAAGNTAALWQKGNELYKQKQYDSAAAYYEQIAAGKPCNALVYYNLGNAYYRQNKVGPAILNYQRALNADPTYKDAKDNLLLAEGRMSNHMQVVEDVFFVTWWNDLTAAARQKFWAIAALLVFIAMVGVMLANRLRPGACLDFSGRTSLDQALAVIAGARAMVSNDSGLMHVAAAFGTPQVAVFGSSSPLHTPPLSNKAQVIWLKNDASYQPPLDCAPCFKRTCPLGHTRCLADISPQQVLAFL